MRKSQKEKMLRDRKLYKGQVDARGIINKGQYRPTMGALGNPGRFSVISNHAKTGIIHFV